MGAMPIHADLTYRTSEFSKASRLEKWRASMSDAYYALDIVADDRYALDAKIEIVTLSNVSISNFRSSTAKGFRTRRDIVRDTTEHFVFVFVTEGEMFFNQLARCGTLAAGQYVMLRSGEPYELSCLRPSKAITLHLPVADVEERYKLAHLHCAKAIESDAVLFPMAASVMQSVGAVPVSARKAMSHDLRRQVVDTILLLLRAERIQASVDGNDGHLGRLIDYIEQNYVNSELSARTAAQDLGMSVSHLHRAFGSFNLTFGSTLRDTRLARSYELLSSSEGQNSNIGEIAFKVGFLDHSHFSKSFRTAFGISPTEVQKGAGRPAP